MNATGKKSLVSLALPFLALSQSGENKGFSFQNIKAECLSKAEEEAQELEKILQQQNGGMPVDPEEMQ